MLIGELDCFSSGIWVRNAFVLFGRVEIKALIEERIKRDGGEQVILSVLFQEQLMIIMLG